MGKALYEHRQEQALFFAQWVNLARTPAHLNTPDLFLGTTYYFWLWLRRSVVCRQIEGSLSNFISEVWETLLKAESTGESADVCNFNPIKCELSSPRRGMARIAALALAANKSMNLLEENVVSELEDFLFKRA
jgi:hypothetical protein